MKTAEGSNSSKVGLAVFGVVVLVIVVFGVALLVVAPKFYGSSIATPTAAPVNKDDGQPFFAGRYIAGKDIPTGRYVITCTEDYGFPYDTCLVNVYKGANEDSPLTSTHLEKRRKVSVFLEEGYLLELLEGAFTIKKEDLSYLD